jgi:spermidine synthase
MDRELWITEKQTAHCGLTLRVRETLVTDQSPFQTIDIVDTYEYGKMLLLDGRVMITDRDEFVYHDMIAHVPANALRYQGIEPKTALVIGGGDGGTVRELLKNPSLEKVILCEIDGKVVDYCRKYFPAVSQALQDPRVIVNIGDGIEFLKDKKNEYDILCVDSTDPIGPAEGLFNAEFYRNVYKALTAHGIAVAQSESFLFFPDLVKQIHHTLEKIFPYLGFYQASIPTYPSGTWCFSFASKTMDPLACRNPDFTQKIKFESTYYNALIHQAAFALPTFAIKKLNESI